MLWEEESLQSFIYRIALDIDIDYAIRNDLQRDSVNLPKQLGFRVLLCCECCFILN